MGPAFANVLKRTPSTGSMPHNGSPLRQSVIARAVRGGTRGGAVYQDTRLPSLVGQPEVLAAELNIGGSPIKDNEIEEERQGRIETAEFGCQTKLGTLAASQDTCYRGDRYSSRPGASTSTRTSGSVRSTTS
jgi:hypothetical protein